MKTAKQKNKTIRGAMALPLLALGFSALGVSCSGASDIVGIHMSDPDTIEVGYGNFSYEGINVSVDFRDGSNKEIPLVEDMVPVVERLKFFKVGEHEVKVVYRNRYETNMPIHVSFNEFKDSYALVGYECVYDGNPHAVTLNQELPEGAYITYPYGNVFTNAGTYEVVGVISKNGYESMTLSTTLTIHQAERDSSGIVFEDATIVYDGEMHSIAATNVPEGVDVAYDMYEYDRDIRLSKVVSAGKYRVVARFTDTSPNYRKIPDRTAILTIEKAYYDVSEITFEDVTREFDGHDYEAKVTNASKLPSGLQVEYTYYDENGTKVNSNAKAGIYTMVASFTGADATNYYPIEPLKATLTVAKKVIKISDKVTFESTSVNFDENPHPLAITGTLPTGVSVTYENNDNVYAGEYEVKAIFSTENENETVDVPVMSAYLIINRVRRSVLVLDPVSGEYNNGFSASNIVISGTQASVTGYDPEVFRVTSIGFFDILENKPIAIDKMVDGETYKYVVTFEYLDENLNSSIILSEESDNFTYHEA